MARVWDFGRVEPGELARAEPPPGSFRPPDDPARPAEALAYLVSDFYRGLSLRDGFLLLFRGRRAAGSPGDGTLAVRTALRPERV